MAWGTLRGPMSSLERLTAGDRLSSGANDGPFAEAAAAVAAAEGEAQPSASMTASRVGKPPGGSTLQHDQLQATDGSRW